MKALRYEVEISVSALEESRGIRRTIVEFWVPLHNFGGMFFNSALGSGYADNPRKESSTIEEALVEVEVDAEMVYRIREHLQIKLEMKEFFKSRGIEMMSS